MSRLTGGLIVGALLASCASSVNAQVYTTYYPAPVTTYYAPATVAYYPTAVAETRYRPLIGGSITRWRYVNQPTYVYPSTVAYYPAW